MNFHQNWFWPSAWAQVDRPVGSSASRNPFYSADDEKDMVFLDAFQVFQSRYDPQADLWVQQQVVDDYLKIFRKFLVKHKVAARIAVDPATQLHYWLILPGDTSPFNRYAKEAYQYHFVMRFDPVHAVLGNDLSMDPTAHQWHLAQFQEVDLAARAYFVGPLFFLNRLAHVSAETQTSLALMRAFAHPPLNYLKGQVRSQMSSSSPPENSGKVAWPSRVAAKHRGSKFFMATIKNLFFLVNNLTQLQTLPEERLHKKSSQYLQSIVFAYQEACREIAFRTLDLHFLLLVADKKVKLQKVDFAILATEDAFPASYSSFFPPSSFLSSSSSTSSSSSSSSSSEEEWFAEISFESNDLMGHTFTLPVEAAVQRFTWRDIWAWPSVQQTYLFLGQALRDLKKMKNDFGQLQIGRMISPAKITLAQNLAAQVQSIINLAQNPPALQDGTTFWRQWKKDGMAIQELARTVVAHKKFIAAPGAERRTPFSLKEEDKLALAQITTAAQEKFRQSGNVAMQLQIAQNYLQDFTASAAWQQTGPKLVQDEEGQAPGTSLEILPGEQSIFNRFAKMVQPTKFKVVFDAWAVLAQRVGLEDIRQKANRIFIDKNHYRLLLGPEIFKDPDFLLGPESLPTIATLQIVSDEKRPLYLRSKAAANLSSRPQDANLPSYVAFPGFKDDPAFFIPQPFLNKSPYYAPYINLIRTQEILRMPVAGDHPFDYVRQFRRANLAMQDAMQLVSYRLLELNFFLAALARPEVTFSFKELHNINNTQTFMVRFVIPPHASYQFNFPYEPGTPLPQNPAEVYALPAVQQSYRFLAFLLDHLQQLAADFMALDINHKKMAQVVIPDFKRQTTALAQQLDDIIKQHDQNDLLLTKLSGADFKQFWQVTAPAIQEKTVNFMNAHQNYWESLQKLTGTFTSYNCGKNFLPPSPTAHP